MHGWSFSAEIWQQVHALLPDFEHHTLTYHNCTSAEDFVSLVQTRIAEVQPDVVVGWSLGATLALSCWKANPTFQVLVLSGSLKFTEVWPARVLQQMVRKLRHDPAKVIQDFWQHIGHEEVLQTRGLWPTEALIAGLQVLQDTDHSDLTHLHGHWLHGTHDPLMRPPEQLPFEVLDGGHLLMLTLPQNIAQVLRSMA
ncbi:hypothetical protein GCM10008938_19130 [Deinococcus roseus]|uniref:AB hydrolase-1 domain-containing protein n=1 Tax=Deinococcus roseus TaxID=392414 RepID=A0ABQ2CYZ0_9DEIO|nr:hypothetical protein GCM10008938_19130 [Deinococcus roseus]